MKEIDYGHKWFNLIPGVAKTAALTTISISKEEFTLGLRNSATCPESHSLPKEITAADAPYVDGNGYYISKFNTTDSPRYHNRLSLHQKKMQRYYGWRDKDYKLKDVEYKTNKQAFRDDHFSDEPGIACFGCSFTFGVGLNVDQTWPHFLSQLTQQKTWNLGTPGKSLGPVTLYALNWLDVDLPNLTAIAVLVPPAGRTSVATIPYADTSWGSGVGWVEFIPHISDPVIQNRYLDCVIGTSYMEYDMHIKTLELIAKHKGIPFAKLTLNEVDPTDDDWARDMMHRGPKTMQTVANQLFEKLGKY